MLSITDDGLVRTLTIDNPGTRNAVPREGWVMLATLIGEFEESDQRVLVITGAGEDFCSGADLSGDMATMTSTITSYAWMQSVASATRALHGLTKPAVAAVDGVAVGAGMNLALGCDVVVATDRSRFSEIFVRRGLTVDFGGTWLLPRLIGLAKAKELALTGRILSGSEAYEYGLVAQVVAPDALQAQAAAVATELASGAPVAQRFIKTGFNRALEMSFDEALEYESMAQVACFGSEDVIEGITSFVEKRPPEFKGK